MSQYKSYNKTKRKIQTTFEKVQSNSSEIENQNIKKLEVRYRSENHYKPVTIIPVVSNHLVGSPGSQVSVELIDFPDWAINMARPSAVFNLDSAYKIEEENPAGFFAARDNGTLKNGDLWITTWNTFYWFTKQDGLYKFNFRFDLNVLAAKNVSEFGFSSIQLPLFANINLHILNERNYNEIQSGK